eukprot:1141017-Pelagomonas_calceolata.AAC.2
MEGLSLDIGLPYNTPFSPSAPMVKPKKSVSRGTRPRPIAFARPASWNCNCAARFITCESPGLLVGLQLREECVACLRENHSLYE